MRASLRRVDSGDLIEIWPIPSAARLGSSVRSKGIFLEIRERLTPGARKSFSVKAGELTLRMPEREEAAFSASSETIASALNGIERRPVIPREVEDILGISTSERHRWLKDGRLQSAGTRTVSLRGRARAITFHVFDPLTVEDLLARGTVDTWREEDAERAAENRRRAAWNRKLSRSKNSDAAQSRKGQGSEPGVELRGWAAFAREGLLR